jgi:hypothetical protein
MMTSWQTDCALALQGMRKIPEQTVVDGFTAKDIVCQSMNLRRQISENQRNARK